MTRNQMAAYYSCASCGKSTEKKNSYFEMQQFSCKLNQDQAEKMNFLIREILRCVIHVSKCSLLIIIAFALPLNFDSIEFRGKDSRRVPARLEPLELRLAQ